MSTTTKTTGTTTTGPSTGIPEIRSSTFRARLKLREDRGAATAEYIVATMAIVGAKRRKSFQAHF